MSRRAGSLTAALRFGPTAGRPRSGSGPGWLDWGISCLVFGAILSALGGVVAGILTLVGAF